MKLIYFKIVKPSIEGGREYSQNAVIKGNNTITATELDTFREEQQERSGLEHIAQVVICNVIYVKDK